jgi:hypothetical protein
MAPIRGSLLTSIVGLALLGVAGGCTSAAGATLQQLQLRAAYDLACPPQLLTLSHIDPRTKMVAGCGSQEIYVEICDEIRGKQTCTWLLNTSTTRLAHALQARPAASAGTAPSGWPTILLNPGPKPEAPPPPPSPDLPFPEGWEKPQRPDYLPPGI